MQINIYNYGTVNISNADNISEARNELLRKMYYARNKETLGGYQAWKQLLDWYYALEYNKMIEHLRNCKGRGGKTRNECIRHLNIIINGGNH